MQIRTADQNNGAGELMEKTSPPRPILLLSRPVVHHEVIVEECPRAWSKKQVRALDPFVCSLAPSTLHFFKCKDKRLGFPPRQPSRCLLKSGTCASPRGENKCRGTGFERSHCKRGEMTHGPYK